MRQRRAHPLRGVDLARLQALDLAEELGARVVTLAGDDPVQPLALYAATAGIRRIVVPAVKKKL